MQSNKSINSQPTDTSQQLHSQLITWNFIHDPDFCFKSTFSVRKLSCIGTVYVTEPCRSNICQLLQGTGETPTVDF